MNCPCITRAAVKLYPDGGGFFLRFCGFSCCCRGKRNALLAARGYIEVGRAFRSLGLMCQGQELIYIVSADADSLCSVESFRYYIYPAVIC